MSTNDVPGNNPSNADELACGCWAEHDDGSLIFVEGTEGGRVIYSMFDLSKDPVVEYRHGMQESSFKKTFSWDPKKKGSEKWTWHDKTPFDWDRVIKAGFEEGTKYASASDQLTAAERVAKSLKLRAQELSSDHSHRLEREISLKKEGILSRIAKAIEDTLRD